MTVPIGDPEQVQKTCRVCGGVETLDASDIDLTNDLNKKVLRWWSNSPCEACVAESERKAKVEQLHDDFQRRRARSGIPEPFHAYTFSDMDDSDGRRDVIAAAEEWANGSIKRLFLQSRPGTGKSRLAATAAMSALWKRQVYWCNAATLFRQAQADFKSRERQMAEAVMKSKSALVLDDLGNENPSKSTQQSLQALLQHRIDHGARILVTSNLTVPEIASRYEGSADWLASRLATFEQWVLPGIDRRLELPL